MEDVPTRSCDSSGQLFFRRRGTEAGADKLPPCTPASNNLL